MSATFRTPPVSSATIRALGPLPGATVTSLTPKLQWDNANTAVFYYEVQVSKDPEFGPNAFLYWELVHGGASTPVNSYGVSPKFPLEPATTYYWRVRPRVQGDGKPLPWSTSFDFTTP